MPDLSRYFPEGEEGEIRFLCFLYGISRDKLTKHKLDFEAEKNKQPISLEETLAELKVKIHKQ